MKYYHLPSNFLSILHKEDSYFIFELAMPTAVVKFSWTLLTSANAFLTFVFPTKVGISENVKCVMPLVCQNFNKKWVQLILTRSTIFATTFIHTFFKIALHHQSCIIVIHMECKQVQTQEYKIYRNFPSIYKLLEHSKSIRSLLPLDYQCC